MAMLVLIFLGCAKDTPPPPPGTAHVKSKARAGWGSESDNSALFMPSKEQAEERMKRLNPFLTLEEEKTFGTKSREVLTDMRLSAIFNSAKGAYAIVDGKVLKINDKIYGKVVLEINRNNVVLKDASREYVINLVGI